ncbi:MAG: asparagine synthase-related protein, partial [bacterium]|nr:asparagine synthase-related protein [bacterium]
GMTTKYLLKKLMEGKLPSDIIHRKKQGFGVPVGAWLCGPLRGWAEGLLTESEANKGGFFDPRYARSLFAEHLAGKADHRKKLWNILVFLEWQRNFLR